MVGINDHLGEDPVKQRPIRRIEEGEKLIRLFHYVASGRIAEKIKKEGILENNTDYDMFGRGGVDFTIFGPDNKTRDEIAALTGLEDISRIQYCLHLQVPSKGLYQPSPDNQYDNIRRMRADIVEVRVDRITNVKRDETRILEELGIRGGTHVGDGRYEWKVPLELQERLKQGLRRIHYKP